MADKSKSKETLRTRFSELWKETGANGDWKEVFRKTSEAYSDDGRTYHNLSHIAQCMEELDRIKGMVSDPAAVEFALWFHDVIYDSKNSDKNEEKSAEFACEVAKIAGLPEGFIQEVKELIIATDHKTEKASESQKYVADIDLAILGKSAKAFDAYDRGIRKEYSWVQEDDYRKARIAALQSFLFSERIYSTDHFRSLYEEKARENISRAILRLQKRPTSASS
jgi:predicted metal-dependent HD superfamily phosphohydrolase